MDLPREPFDDAVMASREEISSLHAWAESVFAGLDASGRRDFLLAGESIPYSVFCDGTNARGRFRPNAAAATDGASGPGWHESTHSWTHSESRLEIHATVRLYDRFPAIDWLLVLKNAAESRSPLVESLMPLDILLDTTDISIPVVAHRILADHCCGDSYAMNATRLGAGDRLEMASAGGRSSKGAFPFFTIQYGDEFLVVAIGWSGQWKASLERGDDGRLRIQAGMESLKARLDPGESIRTPRILLMRAQGEHVRAQNRFRRLMLHHYTPQHDSRPARMPAALQCFNRYVRTRPDWATEAGQLHAARVARDFGLDTLWFDAAWFPGGFPDGVGNWYPNPEAFPEGLKPIGDACHEMGLKFVLWFEPERVASGSWIAREYPQYVVGGADGGLFKLHDPEARRWLTDLTSKQIDEFGIDVYRIDCNMDPLEFWRRDEPNDRQGINEIRYIEGLYAMWDELLERHPGLVIDNCASGGLRIDIETVRRALTFWRSDTNCTQFHWDWNQAHTHGLSLYLPLHMANSWTPDAYEMRSAACAGISCEWDYLDSAFPAEQARTWLLEAMANREYWYGDFYPLTVQSHAPDRWCAFQLHRSDLDAGLILAFRREESPYPTLECALSGLDVERKYGVTFRSDDGASRDVVMGSAELRHLTLALAQRRSSLVVRYEAR